MASVSRLRGDLLGYPTAAQDERQSSAAEDRVPVVRGRRLPVNFNPELAPTQRGAIERSSQQRLRVSERWPGAPRSPGGWRRNQEEPGLRVSAARAVPVQGRQHTYVLRTSSELLRPDHIVQVCDEDFDAVDNYAVGSLEQLRIAAVETRGPV